MVLWSEVPAAGAWWRPFRSSLSSRRSAAGGVPPPVLVLVGILSVQVGAAVASRLFAAVGPGGAVTLRLVVAALVLLAVARPSVRGASRADLLAVAGFGLVLGAMNLSFYEAIARLPLGIAVTIEFVGPLGVALGASRRWRDGLWAALAAAGILLLARPGGGLTALGAGLALAAGACWAAYILLSQLVGGRWSGTSGLALAMVLGSLVALPFGVRDGGAELLSLPVLATGAAVAVLSSVVPYTLELEALRRLPARVFGVLMSLEPAVAALVGLTLLSQSLSSRQWVAIVLVMVACGGATYGSGGSGHAADGAGS